MKRIPAVHYLFGVSAALFLCAIGSGCVFGERHGVGGASRLQVDDPHSAAKPKDVVVTELKLSLSVDFEMQRMKGVATWKIERNSDGLELWLDTRDLEIHRVVLSGGPAGLRDAEFELGEDRELLGRALRIEIDDATDWVQVHYTTSPKAAAVQWLSASQTAGGKKPFLFTQSQAILARTWIPCQDTPGVRFTYTADVLVEAGLTALMSAGQTSRKEVGESSVEFSYEMPQAIPSYLMALAVGDLAFRAISDRCGVWAEPSLLEKSAWEFGDTEKMMVVCEKLFGPYRWQRYDILVLPPSFPFGGMENPRLTFVTPTILAGDRSLTALIAHELAHSWSGNLVTNATWDDFWLNEGFTVYLEHRIMEALYGKDYDEMLAKLGIDGLRHTVETMTKGPNAKPADSHLKLHLAGRDPDDGMTDIAYEKGYLFLRTCEEIVGREPWDKFLRGYFDAHAFQPMTTEAFLAYLRANLTRGDVELEAKLQIDAWVYGPGIPSNAAKVESDAFATVEAEVKKFTDGADAKTLATDGWSSHEWRHFLKTLPRPLASDRLANLDAAFQLTTSTNSEIICQWFLVTIPSNYEPANAALESFLVEVGRRKFLQPLYEALAETAAGKEFGRRVYAKARPGYHVISTGTIDKILDWKP